MPTPVWKPMALVPASGPVAGVVWMTISMALFAGLAVFARAAMNAGLHPFEVVFLRNLVATLMLSPLLFWRGASLLKSRQLSLYGLRVVVSLLSMLAWFYALALIPIGEVTAISFLAPVFGTVGAIFLLGERVRLRRWTAIIVGFLGAMIILRPGMTPREEFHAMWVGLWEFFRDHPAAFRFLETHNHGSYLDAESIATSDAVFASIVDFVRRGQDAGALRAGSPAVLIAMSFGAFIGLVKEADAGRLALDDGVVGAAEEIVWTMLRA